jgi:AcrR family transcriptional regulator
VTQAAATERGARERILAAAVERIASDGIDDMRIARVAMDAGVSTSLVHYHFETREALLAEALEYSYELAADVRLGDGEEAETDPQRRLLVMVDQCLPYPGALRQDWVLWVELWLRTVRHPELGPTAARLYERMRDWLSEGIVACGVPAGRNPGELADRALAMCDGLGVRVLIGEMPIEYAREQVWGHLADELDLDHSLVAS